MATGLERLAIQRKSEFANTCDRIEVLVHTGEPPVPVEVWDITTPPQLIVERVLTGPASLCDSALPGGGAEGVPAESATGTIAFHKTPGGDCVTSIDVTIHFPDATRTQPYLRADDLPFGHCD